MEYCIRRCLTCQKIDLNLIQTRRGLLWSMDNQRRQERTEEIRCSVYCMGCRTIHLETVNTTETDSFINALRRFLSIRGPIRQLRSDQGTNLVGAKNELERALSETDDTQVQQFLLKQGCDYFRFNMNVPSASNMGGSLERHIRTVRNIMSSLLDEAGLQLNDESRRTLMCEAAAIVNGRPLTVDSLYDATSLEPLTPNHLLTLKSKVILPPQGEFLRADVYARRRWRRLQHLANESWTRWKKESCKLFNCEESGYNPNVIYKSKTLSLSMAVTNLATNGSLRELRKRLVARTIKYDQFSLP